MRLTDFCKTRHGAAQRLADALGVSGSLVVQWAAGKPITVDRCAHIERATQGAVSCEELRPDRTWHRVPDPEWLWHAAGRPMLDVSADLQVSASATPVPADQQQAA